MVKVTLVTRALVLSSVAATATASASGSALPNWVGPHVGRPIDSACYRKTVRAAECPLGYDSDQLGGCWAQCPLEYPVACGMECLPQNLDCTLAIITKIGAVANVVLNAASNGMVAKLIGLEANVADGIKCGVGLFNAVTRVVQVAGVLQHADPELSSDALLLALLETDEATQLTGAVVKCTGAPSAVVDGVTKVVAVILDRVVRDGDQVLAPDAFLAMTSAAGVDESLTALPPSEMASFRSLLTAGAASSSAACGLQLRGVMTRVVHEVVAIKTQTPTASEGELRTALAKSPLVRDEMPQLTNACVADAASEDEAFALRELIRKALQTLIDQVVDGAYQNGNPVPVDYYLIVAANLGLEALSQLDPTGLAALAKEFVQPICGPTSLIGEVDDGDAALALGLRTMDRAFNGSSGVWTRAGDGMVSIAFQSVDTEDVTVNINSGGRNVGKVAVAKGQRATWTKPIQELQDKTLYLDRWRPGFLGIPGTGGGSLLAWVPRASEGGHLELQAMLNVS